MDTQFKKLPFIKIYPSLQLKHWDELHLKQLSTKIEQFK